MVALSDGGGRFIMALFGSDGRSTKNVYQEAQLLGAPTLARIHRKPRSPTKDFAYQPEKEGKGLGLLKVAGSIFRAITA